MKDKANGRKIQIAVQIAATVLLLAFLAYSFFSFMMDNSRRIVGQNDSFVEAAARETADRIDTIIQSSERNAELIARLYEQTMTTPVVDADILKDMVEQSGFDYIEFINSEGTDLTADGRTADLSDRDYYISGMSGSSGISIVYNSRITDETLLIFYTPFRFDGEIIGVLSCILRGQTVSGLIEASYFGVTGSTYILERNGDVVVSSGTSGAPKNLLDSMRESGMMSDEDLKKLGDTIDSSNEVNFNSFNYRGRAGEGSAYVTVLESCDLVFVESFPSSVTGEMTRMANSAGVRLEIKLVAAFLAYLIYIIIRSWLQRRRLVSEKQEMTSIVDAVSMLFTRFAVVDFSKNRYYYVKNSKAGAPEEGSYSDLVQFLGSRYIDDPDSTVKMRDVITPGFAKENLTKDVPYLQYEYQIDLNGKRWEHISLICLSRRKGHPSTVLYAIQDVTELNENDQRIRLALKNSMEAAEAANQAKTDFLARMSHDIRTPMNAIMGMTAVAAMHLDDRERLTDCLGKITVSSRHLLALINDILDMSKIESGKVSLSEEPFLMADLVDSVATIIKNQAKSKNQDFRIRINDIDHENVIGDTLRLRQVFLNILGNAVKFTPEGGRVTFTIRELESHINGMACFEFVSEDNGIGMDEEFIDTIFDPFSRSKQSANIEGTGLGMPITRNIIRMMSGEITVESKVGVGSKFTVQLHLKLQEPKAEDVGELADLRVLVADDDRDACVSASEILSDIGMKASWVLSGEEAVNETVAAKEAGEDFSAVILDWKMPGMDGVETARELRKRIGEDIPIIILSAYDWTDIEQEAREAGVQAFIEKPLFRSRLVYALKSVLSSGPKSRSEVAGALEEESFKGRRVLLVEDNDLNAEIAAELLSCTDVEVERAENGKIALDKVTSNPPGYYGLVFMDIRMPVMDGYEAAKAIRASGREDLKTLPIVAMTANAFADDIFMAHEAGMNDHISKPVEIEKLAAAMKKWLGEAPK